MCVHKHFDYIGRYFWMSTCFRRSCFGSQFKLGVKQADGNSPTVVNRERMVASPVIVKNESCACGGISVCADSKCAPSGSGKCTCCLISQIFVPLFTVLNVTYFLFKCCYITSLLLRWFVIKDAREFDNAQKKFYPGNQLNRTLLTAFLNNMKRSSYSGY